MKVNYKTFVGFIFAYTSEHTREISELLKITGPQITALVLEDLYKAKEIIRQLTTLLENTDKCLSAEIGKKKEKLSHIIFSPEQMVKIKGVLSPTVWDEFNKIIDTHD